MTAGSRPGVRGAEDGIFSDPNGTHKTARHTSTKQQQQQQQQKWGNIMFLTKIHNLLKESTNDSISNWLHKLNNKTIEAIINKSFLLLKPASAPPACTGPSPPAQLRDLTSCLRPLRLTHRPWVCTQTARQDGELRTQFRHTLGPPGAPGDTPHTWGLQWGLQVGLTK